MSVLGNYFFRNQAATSSEPANCSGNISDTTHHLSKDTMHSVMNLLASAEECHIFNSSTRTKCFKLLASAQNT